MTGVRAVCELLPPDTALAHPAMRSLRHAYADRERFVARVDMLQRPEGYRLVGAFTRPGHPAVAVAGFRVGHSLSWGAYLYVDDLVTVPTERGCGHAGAVLDWLVDEATRLSCDQIHLDSGTGPDRFDAHRLYHDLGLAISAHHFCAKVEGIRLPLSEGAPRSRPAAC